MISVFSRQDIETIIRRNSRYPLRPPQEVISHYRRTRRDRYTNLGLVNEWVVILRFFDSFKLRHRNGWREPTYIYNSIDKEKRGTIFG